MIEYNFAKNTEEKFRLMKFVYQNTDNFILNTFGYIWESRNWWDQFPITTYMIGDEIAGLHAFTIDTKAPDTIKTYYIVTGKCFRGKGIAKKLTLDLLGEYSNTDKKYFVNSEENSDGIGFYKKIFNDRYTISINEFGTIDYNFQALIKQLYNDLSNNNSIPKK